MKKVLEHKEQKGFRKGHTEQSRSNKHLVYSLFAVFFALLSFNVLAQGGSAFFNEIEGFKKEDSLHPDPYYKLWIFFNDGKTISISLDYFKNSANQHCVGIGWLWRHENIDKEALTKVKSEKIKQ